MVPGGASKKRALFYLLQERGQCPGGYSLSPVFFTQVVVCVLIIEVLLRARLGQF